MDELATVVRFGPNNFCQVLLADGREIKALVSKRTLRDMLLIRPGDKVRVEIAGAGHPRVKGFGRSR